MIPSNSRFISTTDWSDRGPWKSRTMVNSSPTAGVTARTSAQMPARCIGSYEAPREIIAGEACRRSVCLDKRHRLDAGDVEALAAAHVLAGDFIVQQDHVALRFGELGAVALVGALRDAVLLLTHHPAEFVTLAGLAPGTVQGRRLGGLRIAVKRSFVHDYLCAIGIQDWPSGLPLYSARGRIRRLL